MRSMYGWFSKIAEADPQIGSTEIESHHGRVVRITEICDDMGKSIYPDAVYVGVVLVPDDGNIVGKNISFDSGYQPIAQVLLPICAACGHEWKERLLFLSKYIGCFC